MRGFTDRGGLAVPRSDRDESYTDDMSKTGDEETSDLGVFGASDVPLNSLGRSSRRRRLARDHDLDPPPVWHTGFALFILVIVGTGLGFWLGVSVTYTGYLGGSDDSGKGSSSSGDTSDGDKRVFEPSKNKHHGNQHSNHHKSDSQVISELSAKLAAQSSNPTGVSTQTLLIDNDHSNNIGNEVSSMLKMDGIAAIDAMFGPRLVSVSYPIQPASQSSDHRNHYDSFAEKEWCITVSNPSSNDEKTKRIFPVELTVKWTRFDIEPGFDYVYIRSFNDTEEDPPHPISEMDIRTHSSTMRWWIEMNTERTVCVMFESDGNDERTGVQFDWIIRLDSCIYHPSFDDSDENIDNSFIPSDKNPFIQQGFPQSVRDEWDETKIVSDVHCHIKSAVGQTWGRGPFYDGKCGIGIKSFSRNGDDHRTSQEGGSGFVECEKEKSVMRGPEYCIKRECEGIYNDQNKQLPEKIRYGWGKINETFNGFRRFDPHWPDPFRIYKAYDSQNKNGIIIPDITLIMMKELQQLLNEIIAEQSDERVLKYAFVPLLDRSKEVMNMLGARLARSLILGKRFILAQTGSSNTAGHDNMFISTYGIQTQSRLRSLWTRIGNNGASFIVRNAGIGGASNTAFHSLIGAFITTSNTVHDYYYKKYQRDLPRDLIDWLTEESGMNDGGYNGDLLWYERHFRLSNALNGIWDVLDMNDFCYDKKNQNEPNKKWKWPSSDKIYEQCPNKAKSNKPDSIAIDHSNVSMIHKFARGIGGACALGERRYWYSKMNWHPSPLGHRISSLNLVYTILTSLIDFLKNNEHRIRQLADDNNNEDTNTMVVTPKLIEWLDEQSHIRMAHDYWNPVHQNDGPSESNEYCKDECRAKMPFMITMHRPMVWNAVFRFQQYLRPSVDDYTHDKGLVVHWDQYWDVSHDLSESKQFFSLKQGGLGSCDLKSGISPKMDHILDKLANDQKSDDDLSLVQTAEKALKIGLGLNIGWMSPPDSNGSLLLLSGIKEGGIETDYHWFITPLNQAASKQSHPIWKDRTDFSPLCVKIPDIGACSIPGFQPGGKYQLSLFPKIKKPKSISGLIAF